MKKENKIVETKKRLPKKDFAQRLSEKLKPLGEIDTGMLSDRSGRWVSVRVKNLVLNFSFDAKGEILDRVGLYQDVIQVVDSKQLFSFDVHEK